MGVLEQFRMDGKRGFITGAAQGIGSVLADAFAQVGANFVIADIDVEKAEAVAAELCGRYGRDIHAVRCDVSDPASVEGMLAETVGRYGGVDFAINNAGIVDFYPVQEADPTAWKRVLDVNLYGVFLTARAAARQMVEQGSGGTITNMASMSAHIINTPQKTSSYCTSKAGVVQLTKSMAVELAPHNIRVNCVSPGYIANELNTGFGPEVQGWIDRTPQKRMGTAQELCGAYLYLASAASSYATGTEIIIDGGYTLV